MNDHQLESFMKVVEEGSFSKAAQESYISVTAMIEQIDRMEDTLGVSLFQRSNHGVLLTTEGKIFYDAVQKIKVIYDSAISDMHMLQQKQIRIGVAAGQYPEFLMNACAKFKERYPQTELEFVVLPYREHLNALRREKIDLTAIAQPKKAFITDLQYEEFCKDHYAFNVVEEHPLYEKSIIHMDDLKDITVLCETYDYMQDPFEHVLASSEANLKVIDLESNAQSRIQAKLDQAVLVFHSLWTNASDHMFRVIASDINAGGIGVVTRKNPSIRITELKELMKAEITK